MCVRVRHIFAALVVGGCGNPDAMVTPSTMVRDGGVVSARLDAGSSDAAEVDGGASDAALGDASVHRPTAYPIGATQSPLTPYVAARLATIAASNPNRDARVFAKVGASASKSVHFMHCFADNFVDVAGRDVLLDSIAWFRAGDAAGASPFERESTCTEVGRSAVWAIDGTPSPVTREIDAINPRFAAVMYGTNDIQRNDIFEYADSMLDLTDQLIGAGVIPLLTSIMPRDDSAAADEQVPRYNAVVRAIAQGRQVPFIDYEGELRSLPDHGIGGDGVHPTVHRTTAGLRACDFTQVGLQSGYNVRNLVTIEALHRVRSVLLEGQVAPDAPTPAMVGAGTAVAPYEVTLPFSDVRDTTTATSRAIAAYPGCMAAQDESGPEIYYRLELVAPTRVHALVFDRGEVDIDLHLLTAPDGASCVERDHRELLVDLAAGTHWFVLDTFTNGAGRELGGEYLFVVMAR